MRVNALLEDLDALTSWVQGQFPALTIELMSPVVDGKFWNRSIKYDDAHGVYVLSDHGDEILYIGKAQASSISGRVWRHLGVSDKLADIRYPQAFSDKLPYAKDAVEKIMRGEFKIDALRIEPVECSSLLEVYGHTVIHLRDHHLPALNFQLG